MKKFVISLFLLSFSTIMSFSVFSQQPNESIVTLPQGKWVVEQVSIEKNTDGKIENAVYKSAAEVKSYVLCPQEWEINEQNIVIRYPNGWEDTSLFYYVEGNHLTVQTTYEQQYQYSLSGETLTLFVLYNYLNNLPTGQIEHIEENWIIILKNK